MNSLGSPAGILDLIHTYACVPDVDDLKHHWDLERGK